MSDQFISLTFDRNWAKLVGSISSTLGRTSGDIEARITNRQRHAVVAEFGSGIYNDGDGPKVPITPKTAKALLIPVSRKYMDKLRSETRLEAFENAKKHPDILAKVKTKMPGVVGFLFRKSVKGMKPMRMVRDSIPIIAPRLEKDLSDATTIIFGMLLGKQIAGTKFASGSRPRDLIAIVLNRGISLWLREIVKKSPVLTSNLRSGWTISRLAK
jgi:hypothetical protein